MDNYLNDDDDDDDSNNDNNNMNDSYDEDDEADDDDDDDEEEEDDDASNSSNSRSGIMEQQHDHYNNNNNNNNSTSSSLIPMILSFVLLIVSLLIQQYVIMNEDNNNTIIIVGDDHHSASSMDHYHHYRRHRLKQEQQYDNNNDNDDTTTIVDDDTTKISLSNLLQQFPTYESLGPIPSDINESTIKIYNINDIVQFQSSNNNNNNNEDSYHIISPTILKEIQYLYHHDGVICIRGLLSNTILELLDIETKYYLEHSKSKQQFKQKQQQQQFYTVEQSILFQPKSKFYKSSNTTTTTATTTTNSSNNIARNNEPSALMQVALFSNISIMAAMLLNVVSVPSVVYDNNKNNNNNSNSKNVLRVIRDMLLVKDDIDPTICGWHVDDYGFWPAVPSLSLKNNISNTYTEGINAWIALDDMSIPDITGGLGLAVQSHIAPWNMTAYNLTGIPTYENYNYYNGGYHNVSHMFISRQGYGTCNIQNVAYHIHERCEDIKRIYPVQRGDVIFHTRYLFHRTIPPKTNYNHNNNNENENKLYRRYSIRYGIGSTTIIPPGYGTELSVLYNPKNGGRTMNDICSTILSSSTTTTSNTAEVDDDMVVPWYPQAYPHMNTIEQDIFWKQYNTMIQHHIPIAQERLQHVKQEMKPYLQQLSSKRRKRKNDDKAISKRKE